MSRISFLAIFLYLRQCFLHGFIFKSHSPTNKRLVSHTRFNTEDTVRYALVLGNCLQAQNTFRQQFSLGTPLRNRLFLGFKGMFVTCKFKFCSASLLYLRMSLGSNYTSVKSSFVWGKQRDSHILVQEAFARMYRAQLLFKYEK